MVWFNLGVRDNDGRKLDHRTLEVLRLRAVEQVKAGAHPEDVSRALGLHRKTVYGWMAKYREGGKDALTARPVTGRQPKLSTAQMSRLYGLIVGSDPRQMSFDYALWTREMVREVIRRELGVRLSVVSVGRLLRKLGLTPQRPLHRAHQQHPEAVQTWKSEVFPVLREQAAAERATIYFADEAGIRSEYHAGAGRAAGGRSAAARAVGGRYSASMISAITAKGALRFSVYDGNTNAEAFIDFCERLLYDAGGPVYLIVNGHPAHRAIATKQFVAGTDGKLRLVFLPGYSPAHHPDE